MTQGFDINIDQFIILCTKIQQELFILTKLKYTLHYFYRALFLWWQKKGK